MTFWEYLLLSKVVVTSGFLGTVVDEVKNLTQGVVYAKHSLYQMSYIPSSPYSTSASLLLKENINQVSYTAPIPF